MIVLPLTSWFSKGSPISHFNEIRCVILVNLLEGSDTKPFLEQWLLENNIVYVLDERHHTHMVDEWIITFDNKEQAILFKLTFMGK